MGLLGALLGNQRVQIIQNDNTVIQLDCSVSETHSRESTPTEFPVENGQTVSDHIILKPLTLEITGIVSDTPVGGIGGLITEAATSVTSALAPPLGVVGGAAALGIGSALFSALLGSKSPSVAAFLQLLSLQQNSQALTILTSLNRYENMWIRSVSVPRDSNTGKILQFTASFTQLLLVTPQSVNLGVFANAALSAAQGNSGEQNLNLSKKYQQGFSDSSSAVNKVTGGGGVSG